VVGDRLARGFGGALLYLVNDLLAWPVQWISFLSAVLIAGWISVAVMLKREYSRTFRAALDTRTINAEEIQVQLQDAATLEAITSAMAGNDRRQILFALELIADEKDNRLAEPLVRLLSHKSDEVRSTALSRLTDLENTDLSREVEPLLKDPTGDVRALAIRYLCLHTSDNPEKLLTQFLDSDDLLLVSAAARCALELADGTDGARLLTDKHFERVLSSPETENQLAREQLAVALRYIRPGDPLTKVASRFLDDKSIRVRRAALVSASHLKRRDLLPQILIRLGQPSLRAAASGALLAYGPAILGTLRDAMLDTTRPAPVRLRIPKVISQMDTNEAAELLFAQLHIDEALLKYVVIKGLNRARRRMGELTLDTGRIRKLIESETEAYYRLSIIAAVLTTDDNPNQAELFLRRAVADGQARQLDQIFRAAGLIYPISDMYFAYRGAISSARNARVNAIEFLDTVWDLQEKEQLFPILERHSNLPATGRKLFGLSRLSRSEAIGALMDGKDNWLAACAVNLVAVEQLGEHRETITRLTQSQHPVLSETARTAANRLKV
jgi:AAA family ATP:ADP antiporter